MLPNDICGYALSAHAWKRISGRRLYEAVHAALDFGRIVHTRSATLYVIGRKEIERVAKLGVDLSAFEGTQVVCTDDAVLTAYRNRDLRRLRPRKRPWRKEVQRRHGR